MGSTGVASVPNVLVPTVFTHDVFLVLPIVACLHATSHHIPQTMSDDSNSEAAHAAKTTIGYGNSVYAPYHGRQLNFQGQEFMVEVRVTVSLTQSL